MSDAESELVICPRKQEQVASSMYSHWVSDRGFPSGLPTWDEMADLREWATLKSHFLAAAEWALAMDLPWPPAPKGTEQ
ncbi:MAG: hypothetical protein AAGI03_17000 [Pseudomonadota bacterium]